MQLNTAAGAGGAPYALPPFTLEKNNIETFYPASPLQLAMISKSLQSPGQGMYVIQAGFEIRGPLDTACFQRAWEQAMERHPVLRTLFTRLDTDKPMQVVCKRVPLPWVAVDLSACADPEAGYAQWVAADRRRDFDLGRPSLMRLVMLTLGPAHYRFVWCHHHAISDGWSLPVVINDVMRLYLAAAGGPPAALGPRADFQSMMRWIGRQDEQASLSFWRTHLDGLEEGCHLLQGAGTVDPDLAPALPIVVDHVLDAGLTARIEAFCQRQGATPNVLMSALFGLCLSHYLDRDEVVFGSITSGRNADLAHVDKLVGPCLNTVPVRMRCAGGLRVGAWLSEVMAGQARRLPHEYLSLQQIGAQLPGRLRHLFNCLYVYENYPRTVALDGAPGVQGDAFQFRPLATHEANSVPFSFIVAPGERTLVRIAAHPALFDVAFLTRFFADFQGLLTSLLEGGAAQELAQLRRTDAPAISAVHPQVRLPARDLVAAFAHAAQGAAQQPALVCGARELSYGQLDRVTDLLAEQLLAQQVRPGDRVGIMLPPDERQVIAMLAVLKAGACYVPLDINNPDSRNRFILRDAAVQCLVAEPSAAELAQGLRLVAPDAPDHGRAIQLPRHDLAASLAYLIYTSGTTGQPKGVMIEHRHVVRLFETTQSAYRFSAADRWIMLHSFAFDVSVWEIWGALLYGARLYLPEAAATRDFHRLYAVLREQGITVLNQTPSAFYQLAAAAAAHREPLSALRTVVFAGEKLSPGLLKDWVARYPLERVKLVNMYGITEITVHGSYHELTWQDIGSGASVIGRPLADLEMRLLGKRGLDVPPGCVGEIWVAGPGVSPGYWNRAELTAERFVERDGRRYYRSGDLAYLEQGLLVYVARMDKQVQIRGFRVELGEVEHALSMLDRIEQCLVAAVPSASGDDILVAFVADGLQRTPAQLTALLAKTLPHYMVPNRIMVLPALPMTVNGKVDKRALLEQDARTAHGSQPDAAGLDPEEAALAAVWEEVLKCPVTRADADFFELGGHSLLATQLIYAYKKRHQVAIPVQAIFEYRQLGALARHVAGLSRQELPGAIARAARRERGPLSFSQQRLWFLCQLPGAGASYNLAMPLAVRGALQRPALEQALAALLQRHEGLRAGFAMADGELTQFIRESLDPPCWIDADGWSDSALQQAIDARCREPFSLATDALVRITVFRRAADQHVLLLVLHHIVTDGWSNGIILRDLSRLYDHHAHGGALTLPPLPVQYFDYAVWQREPKQDHGHAAQLDYWRRQLRDAAPVLPLPLDFARAPGQFRGENKVVSIDAAAVAGLEALAAANQATLFMVLLGAFQSLLARFCGTSDIVLGTVVANRQRQELEEVVGFFTNTLVIRDTVQTHVPFCQTLRQTRQTLLAAYDNQDVPFDQVVDAVCRERPVDAPALVQVMFVLQNAQQSKGSGAGFRELDVRPVTWQYGQAKFDLTISINPDAHGLHVHLEYKSDLFSAERMEQWLALYRDALLRLAQQSDLSAAELFSAARPPVLADWQSLLRLPEQQLLQYIDQLPEEQAAQLLARLEA
ncbi:amino acid adenylation domain-containing protein [Duganella sp. FT92W]|uniref:Amino acid adenylation domain-containing protein n=1 Tax=Pseudoduganella rivuli TaxID=2666085 RepID=A0A7X2IL96_9BURK|nr:non-ribosomal peptide synthetase [Pseudoduganella rivuli]MRV71989.1 amino acid adenylation domain-containing protein [Pseudoduganella rivuli]